MKPIEKPVGLANMSNSCFFNSVIQALVNCDSFSEGLLKLPKVSHASVLKRLGELISAMQCRNQTSLAPMSLRVTLANTNEMFNNTEQHDAHECYLAFVSEDNKDTDKEKTLKSLFHGKILYNYVCKNGHRTKIEDTFCSISIGLSMDTLGENLQEYFEKKKVVSSCDSPNCSNKEKKCVMSIKHFPEYLVITLKRFYFDKRFVKNNKKININKTLEFSLGDIRRIYELIACINHTGGLEGGHYTTHVLKEDGWYHCNDSGIFKQNDIYEDQVYMAFYRKI